MGTQGQRPLVSCKCSELWGPSAQADLGQKVVSFVKEHEIDALVITVISRVSLGPLVLPTPPIAL